MRCVGAVPMNEWVRTGADGLDRCWWPGDDPTYVDYHDREWGRPVLDDTRLFEKICLEGFQSGLAWITILRKRENFRAAFAGFDADVVARFDESDVVRLLADAGIVRHRGKIEATINNAVRLRELVAETGSLTRHVWSFALDDTDAAATADPATRHPSGLPNVSTATTSLSRDLKRRGWKFVGPTTMYAFAQSMGLVNDHLPGCHVRDACETERRSALARITGGG